MMGLRTMRKIRLGKNLVRAMSIHIDENVFYNTKKGYWCEKIIKHRTLIFRQFVRFLDAKVKYKLLKIPM